AVEHFRKSRVIGNLGYIDPSNTKHFGCASGRKKMHVKISQPFAKFGQPSFVRNAQQRAAHSKHPLLLCYFEKLHRGHGPRYPLMVSNADMNYPNLSGKILSNNCSAALTTSASSGSFTVGFPSRSNFEINGSAGRQAILSFPKTRSTSSIQLSGSSRTWLITSTICETRIGRVFTSSAMRHAAESPLRLGSDTTSKRSISFRVRRLKCSIPASLSITMNG